MLLKNAKQKLLSQRIAIKAVDAYAWRYADAWRYANENGARWDSTDDDGSKHGSITTVYRIVDVHATDALIDANGWWSRNDAFYDGRIRWSASKPDDAFWQLDVWSEFQSIETISHFRFEVSVNRAIDFSQG